MKNIGKIAVLGAVLAASASYAFADTIGSYATGSAMGNINSAILFNGFVANTGSISSFVSNPTPSTGTGVAAVNIGAGAPWANALANSSWISFEANTNPASQGSPTNVAAQGYYTFTTTFSEATSGVYSIALNVLADDTAAIYLNTGSGNSLLYSAGPLSTDSACATGTNAINCETPTLITDNGVSLTGGATDTLTFVVEQSNYYDFGLDFDGTVSQAPEPSSLMLLGSGLVGAAGMFFRRRVTA